MPRVLIAPDSFKGTFSAAEVAAAIGTGFASAGWSVTTVPLADGGEGTASVLASALGGRWVPAEVPGPLGLPVVAGFFLTPDGVALMDAAAAVGLGLVDRPSPASAWAASTDGVGLLVATAVAAGATSVLLGVGGSATTDGGRGAVSALTAAGGLRGVPLRVLCDVRTTYVDAASVFGPQKGADAATVTRLAARLDAYAATLPHDPRDVPMTGCGGGLSGGLWAAFGASLESGARCVLDAVGFGALASSVDLVVTGEGCFDSSSLLGKVVSEVAGSTDRPVHLVVGSSALSPDEARAAGFASLTVAGTAAELTAVWTAHGGRFPRRVARRHEVRRGGR